MPYQVYTFGTGKGEKNQGSSRENSLRKKYRLRLEEEKTRAVLAKVLSRTNLRGISRELGFIPVPAQKYRFPSEIWERKIYELKRRFQHRPYEAMQNLPEMGYRVFYILLLRPDYAQCKELSCDTPVVWVMVCCTIHTRWQCRGFSVVFCRDFGLQKG